VFLGFHDSARKERLRRKDPRALANVDMLDVEASIRHVIEQVRPHVIITFDPHGGYYHPDHTAVQRAATAAFFSSGVLEDEAPSRLFYSTFSERAYREHAEATRGWGVVDDLDPTVFAVRSTMAAVTFDARPYMDLKLMAFAAHQSAFGLPELLLSDPPADAAARLRGFRPIMEEEVFVLGATRGVVPRWPLAGLFDGLGTTLG
jgi:LmbE family N-acetylglucosaminyl deacetylase